MNKHRKPYLSQNKHESKHHDFSPKIPAKRPIQLRRKMMPGQSAHNPQRQHIQNEGLQMLPRQKYHIQLSQEQIKNSATYKLLEEEMKLLMARQDSEVNKLKQTKKQKLQQLFQWKIQKQNIKLKIWELKNQALQLKESIQDEENQNQRLRQQLGHPTQNNHQPDQH